MLTLRYSIARLMGIIVVLALGLTALRNPNETWAGLLIVAACGILALGVVGLVCRGKSDGVWWLGWCSSVGAISHLWSSSTTTASQ